MADAPFLAKLVKGAILKKLWSSICIDYFRHREVSDQVYCGSDCLLCGACFACVIYVRIPGELIFGKKIISAVHLADVHVDILKWVDCRFMGKDGFDWVGGFSLLTGLACFCKI